MECTPEGCMILLQSYPLCGTQLSDLLERAIACTWQSQVQISLFLCIYNCTHHNFVGHSYWILLAFCTNTIPAQLFIMKPDSIFQVHVRQNVILHDLLSFLHKFSSACCQIYFSILMLWPPTVNTNNLLDISLELLTVNFYHMNPQ